VARADEEKAEKEAKAAAQKEKELGNECYKARRTALRACVSHDMADASRAACAQKKELDQALVHYNKAIELDPQEISFLTNRAAVLFEQGKYDDCVKVRAPSAERTSAVA